MNKNTTAQPAVPTTPGATCPRCHYTAHPDATLGTPHRTSQCAPLACCPGTGYQWHNPATTFRAQVHHADCPTLPPL